MIVDDAIDIDARVNTIIKQCIINLYPNIDFSHCSIYKSNTNDYQLNGVNAMAKVLGIDSRDVGQSIANALSKNSIVKEARMIMTKSNQIIVVVDLTKAFIENMISQLLDLVNDKMLPKPMLTDLKKRVLVDFSSPNIAKEMHVGHLRSTIIGESIARTFSYCGAEVLRINHIGDWGTQFGMLIAYIKKFNITDLDITNLMAMYKQSKKLFDSDKDFKKAALLETVALQKGNPANRLLWQTICKISMDAFEKIYKQLDVKLDTIGESFYQDKMDQLVEDLSTILTDTNGAKMLFATGCKLPYIIIKSDGGYTYDTSDLAAIRYRIDVQNVDQVVYVVDSGQKTHLEILFQLASDLGWKKNIRLDHADFGLVLGADGKKLKSRDGDSPKLSDLLDMAYEHTFKLTKDLAGKKHPDWDESTIKTVADKIAVNCIKYSDLANPRTTSYKFNAEKMISVKGNTAVYLMYSMARCRAILKKVPTRSMDNYIVLDDDPTVTKLATKILQYPRAIRDAIANLSPHYLCNYLYELTTLLGKFYEKNRCLEFDSDRNIIGVHEHRIKLVQLCECTMSTFFHLIGLEHIDQI